MFQEKTAEGFSFRIGGSGMSSPKDTFLTYAHNLVFPFMMCKLKPDENQEDGVFEVRVNPKLYDFLKASLVSDELAIFAPLNGLWGVWTFDMIISIDALSSLGVLSGFKDWIAASRNSMKNLISNEKSQSIRKDPKAFKITEEILTSLNILNDVSSSSLLFATVKDVIDSGEMDPDTVIYRLAMSIYHTKFNIATGGVASIIPILDEPSELYLRLSQGELTKKYKEAFTPLMSLQPDGRVRTMKTFITFIVSAYAYYKTVGE